MRKISQKGFAPVEIALVVIILIILGSTGWFVWHSKRAIDQVQSNTTKTVVTPVLHPMVACSGPDETYKGVTFDAPGSTYSFCVPNGWKIYYNGDKSGSSVIAVSTDMVYKPTVKPTIAQTGGKDGLFPFEAVYISKADEGQRELLDSYTKTGTIQAVNSTATTYYHLTGEKDPVGAGTDYLPVGTKQYEYSFVKGGATLWFGYNVAPDAISSSDQSDFIGKVIASTRIN